MAEQNDKDRERHDTRPSEKSVTTSGPTVEPPDPANLAFVLRRNIDALQTRRRDERDRAGTQAKIADAFTRFSGSMTFVYVHLAVVVFWIVGNVGAISGLTPWDSSFAILATIASVEAIFLSTFVLISQNQAAAIADKHSDLDLQINLLTEHEVTRLLTLTVAIAGKLGVDVSTQPELDELKRDVAPEAVLDKIEDAPTDPDEPVKATADAALH